MLRPNGFSVVTHYEEYGDEGHKIGDPVIIQDCGLKNRVLLTGDKDLIHTYAREIKDAKIAVYVTTDNHEGPAKWGPPNHLRPSQTYGVNWVEGKSHSQP